MGNRGGGTDRREYEFCIETCCFNVPTRHPIVVSGSVKLRGEAWSRELKID